LHIDPEDTNSEKTKDNKKKANFLSDYFSSVFTNEPLGELPQMIPVEIQYELKDLELLFHFVDSPFHRIPNSLVFLSNCMVTTVRYLFWIGCVSF
jgi:hypothetical protein